MHRNISNCYSGSSREPGSDVRVYLAGGDRSIPSNSTIKVLRKGEWTVIDASQAKAFEIIMVASGEDWAFGYVLPPVSP